MDIGRTIIMTMVRFVIEDDNIGHNSPSSVGLAARSVLASAIVWVELMNWSSISRIVDRVNAYFCGHESKYDIRTLLVRNKI